MSKFKSKSRPPKKHKSKAPEGSRSAERLVSFYNRRAERRGELGRQTEKRVEKLLAKKLAAGELISFEHFPPNSLEDSQGKDFRVTQEVQNKKVTGMFGVTISLRCQQEHQGKHPNVPCIIIPPEMGDKQIWKRICRICEEANN